MNTKTYHSLIGSSNRTSQQVIVGLGEPDPGRQRRTPDLDATEALIFRWCNCKHLRSQTFDDNSDKKVTKTADI
jgi:hypothetical protein